MAQPRMLYVYTCANVAGVERVNIKSASDGSAHDDRSLSLTSDVVVSAACSIELL